LQQSREFAGNVQNLWMQGFGVEPGNLQIIFKVFRKLSGIPGA
jgi:hypothetical protein